MSRAQQDNAKRGDLPSLAKVEEERGLMVMRPTFIIIGAMKCGTDSLWHYLNGHPDICMSSIKETNYFKSEADFSKGDEWYESLFSRSASQYGEASPNYTKCHLFKGVPERMYRTLADIKLIYILRDPVERIISHYIHNNLDEMKTDRS